MRKKDAINRKMSKPKLLWHLFSIFFQASALTFAGGLAMLPAIQKDLVDKRKLLKEDEFIEAAALSQTLPGMIALNCAVFIGSDCAGLPGALVAGFGAVFPAFAAMLIAVVFFSNIPRNPIVEGALAGIRVSSAALIIFTAVTLGKRIIKNAFTVCVAAAAFIAVFILKINAFPVMLTALAMGLIQALVLVRKKNKGNPNKIIRAESAAKLSSNESPADGEIAVEGKALADSETVVGGKAHADGEGDPIQDCEENEQTAEEDRN